MIVNLWQKTENFPKYRVFFNALICSMHCLYTCLETYTDRISASRGVGLRAFKFRH